MTPREAWRLVGTALLTLVTAIPYAAGIWSAWTYLFFRLPTPIGLLALAGVVIAPVQLVRDIIAADRLDTSTRKGRPPKNETVD